MKPQVESAYLFKDFAPERHVATKGRVYERRLGLPRVFGGWGLDPSSDSAYLGVVVLRGVLSDKVFLAPNVIVHVEDNLPLCRANSYISRRKRVRRT